jgi:hypothetical protein
MDILVLAYNSFAEGEDANNGPFSRNEGLFFLDCPTR